MGTRPRDREDISQEFHAPTPLVTMLSAITRKDNAMGSDHTRSLGTTVKKTVEAIKGYKTMIALLKTQVAILTETKATQASHINTLEKTIAIYQEAYTDDTTDTPTPHTT